MTTCPVLSFTPTTESALRWFDGTHEIEANGFGAARWKRSGLPGPGNVGEQDAQLMDALDLLRHVHDELVQPKSKKPE